MTTQNTQPGLFQQLKASCLEDWHGHTRHAFVLQLGNGTLAEECFRHYLTQDYIFLKHFSRAWALAIYKADNLEDMKSASIVLDGLLNQEMALHLEYCQSWGMDANTVEATTEARANMAYTRYVLEAGMSGDLLDLLVALAPCVIGYAEIGQELMQAQGARLPGNPYRKWVKTYSSDEYQQLAAQMMAQLDRIAAERVTTARLPVLMQHFQRATRLEQDFWTMGINRAY